MKRFALLSALGFVTLLTGCASTETQYVSTKAILKAQQDINRQVAVYYQKTYPRGVRLVGSAQEHGKKWCGLGHVDFDIVSVKLDLLTTSDVTKGATASAATPTVITVKPSFGLSGEKISSQELIFTEYLLPDGFQPPSLATTPQNPGPAPVADRLVDLRDALVGSEAQDAGAPPVPCFVDFDTTKPADAPHQVIIGLKAIDDHNGGISFGLGPVSLGVTADDKETRSNTLTVAFRQHGLTAKTQTGPCPGDPATFCSFEPEPSQAGPMPGPAPAPGQPAAEPPKKMCAVTQAPGVFLVGPPHPAAVTEAPCPDQGK